MVGFFSTLAHWSPSATPIYALPARQPILFRAEDALDAVLENMRLSSEPVGMQLLNRNARKPKKVQIYMRLIAFYYTLSRLILSQANHGKRPCSHVRRRAKRLK